LKIYVNNIIQPKKSGAVIGKYNNKYFY